MNIKTEVLQQIESAFDYRGHVTVVLTDGKTIEGFLFNRQINQAQNEAYIEMFRKDSDEILRLEASNIQTITLTGKDFAAPFISPKK